MGNCSNLSGASPRAGLRWCWWGAEGLMSNKRVFAFAEPGYLLVMLSNALFCSPSTSSASGQNMAWKKDVLYKKTSLNSRWGKKAIKTQISGIFLDFFNLKLKNILFVCGRIGNIAFFQWTKPKCSSVLIEQKALYLFSIPQFWVLTPGWAFPLGIPDIAAILSTCSDLQRGFSCPTWGTWAGAHPDLGFLGILCSVKCPVQWCWLSSQ